VADLAAVIAGDDNRAARGALVNALRAGEAVLFAGAGVAVPAGYPSWTRLLAGLEDLCDAAGDGFHRDPGARKDIPLSYAETIKRHIHAVHGSLDPYFAYLQREFMKDPQLIRFHRELVSLPFGGFVTTNYDSTLEVALLLRERVPADKAVDVRSVTGLALHEFYRSLHREHRGRRVAHIHGYHASPRHIVLSATDYDDAYGRRSETSERPVLVDFLHTVVATSSFVFVGFSFQDAVFLEFLDASSKRLNLWDSATHFALIGTSDGRLDEDLKWAKRLNFSYGIETIFFPRVDDSFQSLYDLITEICEEFGVAETRTIVDINDSTIEGMRG
jgi:hypothetical protein